MEGPYAQETFTLQMQDWRHTYQRVRALIEAKRIAEALEQAEAAVQAHTANYPLWELLGIAARQAGKHDLAVTALTRAVAIDSAQPTGHNNLGNALRDTGQYHGAVEAYQNAIALKPDHPEAHNNLGAIKRLLGDAESAVSHCQRAIALRPDYAEAHHNSGMALKDLARDDEAIAAFRHAASLNPRMAEAHYHLGNALLDNHRHDEAIASFRNAIASAPDFSEAHYNLANALRDCGNLNEAVDHYTSALRANPTFATAWRTATSMTAFPVDAETLEQLQILKQDSTRSAFERCELGFALYQCCKRLNRLDEGFEYLQEANRLRKRELGYQPERDVAAFNHLAAECELWVTEQQAAPKHSEYRPIFIVGMPRSGTTLVEHIISGHHDVTGLGELPFARASVLPLLNPDNRENTAISDRAAGLRRGYLSLVANRLPMAGTFTDKMPQNFLWLPMLASAFPEAKFVHVYRDPHATCWSLYERFFPADGLEYSYDLSDVAGYYDLYRAWMQDQSTRLGSRLFHLNYDQLTVEPEETIARLASYLGLALERDMLTPHRNDRLVRTASNEQIRQPIYAASSEQWKQFKGHVGNLWDALAPFLPPEDADS